MMKYCMLWIKFSQFHPSIHIYYVLINGVPWKPVDYTPLWRGLPTRSQSFKISIEENCVKIDIIWRITSQGTLVSVCQLVVGLTDAHKFLKWREVTLPSPYRSTCFVYINIKNHKCKINYKRNKKDNPCVTSF